MASLVQDVWLGWGPRLRARRFAPWEEAAVRVVFCPDRASTLDDPLLLRYLESLAEELEVIAWEVRGQGASGGRFGPEVLDDARRLVAETPTRWGGEKSLVLGGSGLGGWLALAAADQPGVSGAFALAASLEPAGPLAPALAEALEATFTRTPLAIPTLLVDPRDQGAEDEARAREWLAREPRASRALSASRDLLLPPWDGMLRAWAGAIGRATTARR